MKKIFFIIAVFSIVIVSCKKDLDTRFYNPDALSQGVSDPIPGMLTSTQINVYLNLDDYFQWYYSLSDGLGIQGYSQIAERYVSSRYGFFSEYNDLINGNGFEDYGLSSVGGHIAFEQTYLDLKSWETTRGLEAQRQGQDKTDADMYFKLLSVIKDYQTARLVDLCNSIPYFDAFQGSSGQTSNYFPQYDDPQKIYEALITDLGNLVDSIPIVYGQMSSNGQSLLKTQDIIFNGNIDSWVRYANALRLKFLVRIAEVDGGFAKPIIQETLSKPLPVQDLSWHTPYQTDLINGITWQRGIREQPYTTFIPNIIMKRMNYGTLAYEPGIDDPRLPAIAMPTYHHDYRGISYNIDSQTVVYNSGEKYYPYVDNINYTLSPTNVGYGNGGNSKSMYSHVTFHNNPNLPVNMFTLGELDLLLAEVELKSLGATGKTAGDHIKDEVIHSTNFWYTMNGLSTYPQLPVNNSAAENAVSQTFDTLLHPTLPSSSVIAAWGDTIKTKLLAASGIEDQMEIVMQQKYIHLNIFGVQELWTELRRTRHPKLEPFKWQGALMTPQPERIHYPNSELNQNITNLQKVISENNNTSPIFWVPPSKVGVPPYWPNYNYPN